MNKVLDTMQEEALPRVNELRRFIRVMLNRAVVVFGVIIIGAVIVCAIFAPIVAPYDPMLRTWIMFCNRPTSSISWAAIPLAEIP